MKNKIRLVFALALVLGLSSIAYALTKQVTTVSGTAAVVFTPGWDCQWVTVSNTGSGDVMLSFDGTAPTASVGFPLAHATSVCIVYGGSSQKNPMQAIMQTGTTTTLNFTTPETNSK